MDVTLKTYGQSLMTEMAHMEVMRIPDFIASMVRAKLGEPYACDGSVRRWAATIEVPTWPMLPMMIPFEMVACSRGASIRCHWDHVAVVAQVIERMVPDIIVDVVPNVIRTASR